MAQEQVNGILNALKISQERRHQQFIDQVEQQRADQQNQQHQDEIKQQKLELAERGRQFDITTKAAKAMHDMTLLEEEQKLSGNLQQGMSIPGAVASPGVDADHLSYQVPGVDQPLQVLTPEAFRKKQIADQTALQAPEHINRMEEISEQAKNAQQLATQNRDAQLQQAQVVQGMENDRADKERASRERISANEIANRTNIAKMNAGLTDGDGNPTSDITPGIASNYLQQGLTGKMSAEDFAKAKLPSGPQKIIANAMQASGGRFLSDKEKSALDSFEAIPQIFNNIDALNKLTQQTGLLAAHIPGTSTKQQVKNYEDQIEASMPQISRFLGESGRLSNQQIGMTVSALQPDLNPLTSSPAVNIQRRDGALATLRAEYEKTLGGLPTHQADVIRSNSKFHQIPFAGAQQGKGQQQGPTHLYFDAQGNQVQQQGVTQ